MGIGDIGARLRCSREARGLSIGSLAQRTRVQPRIIAAIEINDLSSIPPKPYGRGFVRAYATEVGLDPEHTVRDYFAQFAPVVVAPAADTPRPEIERRRPAWPMVLGAAAIVTFAVVGLWGSAWRSAAAPERGAVGTSGATPGAVAPQEAAAPAAAQIAGSPSRDLIVTLAVTRPCWVTATADGERAVYALLQPGARPTLRASKEIVIRAGDAGALTWSVNGRELGPLGTSGQVRTIRVTPQNAATFR